MKKSPFLIVILVVIVIGAWFLYQRLDIRLGYNNPNPTVTESSSETPDQSGEIEVFLPTLDTTTVGTKFVIYGKGRAFENVINYRISDGDGTQLFLDHFHTGAPDAGILGYFHQEVDLAKILRTIPPVIRLDVYEASAKDGSDIHKTSFNLNIDQSKTAVFAYFTNSNLDPENTCQKVYALPRLMPKTQSVLRGAIEELLEGLSRNESSLYFNTSINSGVKLNSVKIIDATAYIDFNDSLMSGGSCTTFAIREQIAATAKQFSNVRNVIISVRGETEGILEP